MFSVLPAFLFLLSSLLTSNPDERWQSEKIELLVIFTAFKMQLEQEGEMEGANVRWR